MPCVEQGAQGAQEQVGWRCTGGIGAGWLTLLMAWFLFIFQWKPQKAITFIHTFRSSVRMDEYLSLLSEVSSRQNSIIEIFISLRSLVLGLSIGGVFLCCLVALQERLPRTHPPQTTLTNVLSWLIFWFQLQLSAITMCWSSMTLVLWQKSAKMGPVPISLAWKDLGSMIMAAPQIDTSSVCTTAAWSLIAVSNVNVRQPLAVNKQKTLYTV